MRAVTFCGRSGKGYQFEAVDKDASWAKATGVALFTARSGAGLRVIRIAELTGKAHDVRAIWALAEAERYGASEVFVLRDASDRRRCEVLSDLEAGLSPVCPNVHHLHGPAAIAPDRTDLALVA